MDILPVLYGNCSGTSVMKSSLKVRIMYVNLLCSCYRILVFVCFNIC